MSCVHVMTALLATWAAKRTLCGRPKPAYRYQRPAAARSQLWGPPDAGQGNVWDLCSFYLARSALVQEGCWKTQRYIVICNEHQLG